MFSGIVEEYATLVALVKDQENIHFTFKCSFVNELKIDQSISHNGVCLTVVTLTDDTYTVTAMKETLERSNLGLLKVGDKVNVERSMMMNGRLDGHIVQGHVDQTATCIDIKDAEGSWYFTFRYAFDKEMAKRGYITVDKGSVTVNGVSLTVCNPTDDTFQVAIIPYTYEHTNFHTFTDWQCGKYRVRYYWQVYQPDDSIQIIWNILETFCNWYFPGKVTVRMIKNVRWSRRSWRGF